MRYSNLSYVQYIRQNKLVDSKISYKKYLIDCDEKYNELPDFMKGQKVDGTYRFRFKSDIWL